MTVELTSGPAGGVAAASGPAGGDPSGPPLIRRAALLATLLAPDGPRIVLLSAPAGSGKSTLLAQIAAEDTRPVAMVHLTKSHADPALLVGDVADAIASGLPDGRVAAIRPRLGSGDPMRSRLRFSRAIAAEPRGARLILDDVHLLRDEVAALDVLTMVVDQLPPGWCVTLAERTGTALPLARWGLTSSFAQLGYGDLALDDHECRLLLASLGVPVSDALVREVRDRTEGWPAGVYLAGLSLRSERPLRSGSLVAGDDALVRSYLDSEILAGADAQDRELLVRTSILDEVSGPLAEVLTDEPDAAERLQRIGRLNLMVVAVDRQERWYRSHSLLRERLHRELEDRGPAAVQSLHARAAGWFEADGRIGEAVTHAFASGSTEAAARLVSGHLQTYYRAGHSATIRGWLERFDAAAYTALPSLALAAALFAATEGDAVDATRWAELAGIDDADRPPVPGDDLDRSVVRMMLCPDGPERMLADADLSLSVQSGAWPWRTTALLGKGAASMMLGQPEAAESAWEEAERTPGTPLALARLPTRAERALLAMGHRRWSDAQEILAHDRRAVLDDPDGGRLAGIVWLIADARLSLHRGDVRGAQDRLRRAQHGRTRLTWAVPWYATRTLTLLASTQLQLGDPSGARASIAQARDIVKARPRLGGLVAALDEVADRVRRAPDARAESSALSPAELRLLPFLHTYLSFKEIGERLGISGNTVKTEAMSIYAKIGATSRSEAVERAVAGGLLEDLFP